MRIVKLDAVESTNDFLKDLCRGEDLENFTVVTAENQVGGRGQMGSKWMSEPSQNLTVSVLLKNVVAPRSSVFDLNIAISVAIANALKRIEIPDISIKWPNDILSGRKKIGGILIENIFRNNGEIWSVAGFGLNVNQLKFNDLPRASSLKNITGKDYDRDELLINLLHSVEQITEQLRVNAIGLRRSYHELLFCRDRVGSFADSKHKKFNGIIRSVSNTGLLEVEMEDSRLRSFSLKEIEMLY